MAKKKAKSSKKLLPAKEITVKSRAYGEHTRAARGSKTPVELNAAFTSHVAKTVVVNSIAKRVHDPIKLCGKGFKEAMLWQVMLSRMRKAASNDTQDLLAAITGMELNSKYPLDRFMPTCAPSLEWGKQTCRIRLRDGMSPHIKSSDTQYLYELYLLMLGKEPKHDVLVSGRSEWMEKGRTTGEIVFSFEVPVTMKYYVVCLHFMSGKNGKPTETMASRGMKITGTGKCGSDSV